MSVTALALLLGIGAVVRLTRLLNDDVLLEPFRDWVEDRYGDASKRAYLVSCPWCASMYIAPIVMTTAVLWGDHPLYLAYTSALTASLAAGAYSTWLDR